VADRPNILFFFTDDLPEMAEGLSALRDALRAGWCDEVGNTEKVQGQQFWEQMEWTQA